MKKDCKKCKFYYKHNTYYDPICCRFPPTHKGQQGYSCYPRIHDSSVTCGEYELKCKKHSTKTTT